MKGGIAGRFSLIFSLLILLATGTVGYMVYWGGRESLMDASTNRLRHTADVIRVRLSASLEAVAKDARFLAATPPVQGLVRARTHRGVQNFDPETSTYTYEWQGQLTEIFSTFLQNRPSYAEAVFFEVSGRNGTARPLVRVIKDGEGVQRRAFTPEEFEREGAFLAAALAHLAPDLDRGAPEVAPPPDPVYLSEIRPDADRANLPTMRAAVPVTMNGGDVFGLVLIRVDARDILAALHDLVDPDKSFFLSNPDGTLLASPAGSGERPGDLYALFPQVAPLLSGERSFMHVAYARHDDGTPLLGYFERLRADYGPGYHDLVLGVTAPYDVILDRVTTVRDRSVLITLLFALGGSLLALGLTGYLTRPLSRITRAVSRFGHPGWRMDLPLGREDELGVLARAFDTMADQIQAQVGALEDKERRQRIILETSAEGILVVDEAGRIETFNSAAERIFGYRADDVIGVNLDLLIELPDQAALPAATGGQAWLEERAGSGSGDGLGGDVEGVLVPEAASGDGALGAEPEEAWRTPGQWREVTGRRRDGSCFPLWLAMSAFSFEGRRKYAGFCHDITERKRYEEALEQAKEHAEDMARLKSAFLANMSHEIRTPLTSIIGYASVLSKHASDDHRQFAELIERSGRRLMDTLNAVLALAQFEAKAVKVDLTELPVADEVREVVQLFEGLAERKRLALSYEVGPDAGGATARLDRGALSSILQNLIGNAIKFTKEGAVTVRVDRDAEHVRLSVTDTGVGISSTFLPHLFDEFRQESSGLNRSHEGAGLGLAITRRLVELMDGTIRVTSRKGEGSCFTVSFPLADVPPAAGESEPEVSLEASAEAEADMPEGVRPRVLLVEDNPDTAFLILHLLGDRCDVMLATSAERALGTAENNRFDVMLLDINLGGEASGIDLLGRLRALPGFESTPAAAVTAYALPGDRERFLAAGFDAYLSKPFTAAELLRLQAELLPQPT